MRKIHITLLLFFMSHSLYAARRSDNDSAGFINRASRSKGKIFDRASLTRAIDETLVLVEYLSQRLKHASQEEIEEVWACGTRNFRLKASEVREGRKACESMLRALTHDTQATELDHEKAKAYRNDARDQIRSHHKKKSEEYVQNFRNWLIINEGVLRQSQEKKTPAP